MKSDAYLYEFSTHHLTIEEKLDSPSLPRVVNVLINHEMSADQS